MRGARVRRRIMGGLLPRLEGDGRGPLWGGLGRKFTGLSSQEADRLSRENKEFIQQLFPPGEIYATIFSQKIQDAIGEVGPETAGAKSMLTQIGFRYDERIDPFDGGPHYSSPTELIEPIRRFRRAKLSAERLPPPPAAREGGGRRVSGGTATARPRRAARRRAPSPGGLWGSARSSFATSARC